MKKNLTLHFTFQILKKKLLLFTFILSILLFVQCDKKNEKKIDYIFEIDSIVINNFFYTTDRNPKVIFYSTYRTKKQDSLFIYKHNWYESIIKEKSHFWVETDLTKYDLKNINNFSYDSLIILKPNENYSFENELDPINCKFGMKSLSEILNQINYIYRDDLKIKFWSITSIDTISATKSKNFKIILKLDDEIISFKDSIKMNLRIQPPEIKE